MRFTDADLREFIELWREEFHETISEDDARRSANALVEFCALIASSEANP